MSYKSERTGGTQVLTVPGISNDEINNFPAAFTKALTGDYNGSRSHGLFSVNNDIKYNGTTFTFKNTDTANAVYNTYDLIAAAVAAGYSYEQIDKAMDTAFTALKNEAAVTAGQGHTYGKTSQQYTTAIDALNQYGEIRYNAKEAGMSVAEYMNQYTVPSIGNIAAEMNKTNPAYNARIITRMNKDGKTYTYTLVYTDPRNGKAYEHALDADKLVDADGNIPEEKLNTWLRGQGLEAAFSANATADEQIQTGNAALKALGYTIDKNGNLVSLKNVGSVNANNDLTSKQWNSLEVAAPDTKDLKAWNKSKDANIFNNVYKNMSDPNADPDLIGRASLEDLQALAGTINEQNIGTTQRNIDNQRRQLLQQIKNDPELYNAITQQLRTDNAAGTVAGQRAANAQKVAAEADANYDKSASDLYSSLFAGENAVAGSTRSGAYGNQIGALDQYITGALNNLTKAAKDGQIKVQDLNTFATTLGEMLGIDLSKYDNAAGEAAAEADARATEYTTKISGDTKTAISEQDAKLREIGDTLGISTDYLQAMVNGAGDTTAALNFLERVYENAGKGISGGYTAVTAPEAKEIAKEKDKQYSDFVSQDFSKWLADDAIDSLTKQKTLEDLMTQYGLEMLTEDKLKEYYEGYAKDANRQSDKVFNQAQRAYIAAVTAGDAKTTDQLVKLATNASTSKKNLYATSALSNQFKQQLGMGNSGRQLATDAQNQAAANLAAIAQAGLDSNKALTGYLGNGSDTYEQGTLYGAHNTFNQNSADARDYYSRLGVDIANVTQGINNVNSKIYQSNIKRLGDTASSITLDNATAGANNATNAGTRKTYGAKAGAMVAQGRSTKK